ncbi:MAG: hypothetical protein IPG43_20150 [Proteobacteria bacterium]|nr:hypothetical protein [Pseudomonadota bacterium]
MASLAQFRSAPGRRSSAGLLLLVIALWAAQAHAAISSTFDSDADGWTGMTFTNQGEFVNATLPGFNFHAAGGNPGGYVSTLDPGPTLAARLGAPGKFLGNQSAFLGGSVSFDLTIDRTGPVDQDPPPLLLLQSGAASLLFIGSPVPQLGSWTSYIIPLAPLAPTVPFGTGWYAFAAGNPLSAHAAVQADFDAIMTNLTHFSITGEFINDGANFDTVGLDNVVLQAVSIPPTLLMLLGGMGGVLLMRRHPQAREANRAAT